MTTTTAFFTDPDFDSTSATRSARPPAASATQACGSPPRGDHRRRPAKLVRRLDRAGRPALGPGRRGRSAGRRPQRVMGVPVASAATRRPWRRSTAYRRRSRRRRPPPSATPALLGRDDRRVGGPVCPRRHSLRGNHAARLSVRPDAAGPPADVVMTNGSDGSWPRCRQRAPPRPSTAAGSFVYDGPGQQSMLFEREVPFRHNWEAVLTPVVDALVARARRRRRPPPH